MLVQLDGGCGGNGRAVPRGTVELDDGAASVPAAESLACAVADGVDVTHEAGMIRSDAHSGCMMK